MQKSKYHHSAVTDRVNWGENIIFDRQMIVFTTPKTTQLAALALTAAILQAFPKLSLPKHRKLSALKLHHMEADGGITYTAGQQSRASPADTWKTTKPLPTNKHNQKGT